MTIENINDKKWTSFDCYTSGENPIQETDKEAQNPDNLIPDQTWQVSALYFYHKKYEKARVSIGLFTIKGTAIDSKTIRDFYKIESESYLKNPLYNPKNPISKKYIKEKTDEAFKPFTTEDVNQAKEWLLILMKAYDRRFGGKDV